MTINDIAIKVRYSGIFSTLSIIIEPALDSVQEFVEHFFRVGETAEFLLASIAHMYYSYTTKTHFTLGPLVSLQCGHELDKSDRPCTYYMAKGMSLM